MKTSEPSTRPCFIDGFFDSFSGGFCRVCGYASSASYIGPRHASRDACVGSSPRPSGDHCLFASENTRFSSRVALSRQVSKGVSSSSHSNRHLHHAHLRDKLSASFTHVAKAWVLKYMLANPSESKTRASLSSHV